MCQHLVSFTPEQEAGQSTASMRGHEDEVATALCRGVDDGFVGYVAGQREFVAFNAGVLAQVFHEAENFLRLAFRQLGKSIR
jgi:hypothetical protein